MQSDININPQNSLTRLMVLLSAEGITSS